MWLDNLKELTTRSKLTPKQIAERAMISEKTIDRTLDGKVKTPYADTLYRWCKAIGASLDDILADTKVVVGTENLATLQDKVEITSAEADLLAAENAVLKEKIAALTAENNLLSLQLKHKEEIIAIHNYYIKLKDTNREDG